MKTLRIFLFCVLVLAAAIFNGRAAICDDASAPKIVVTKALFGSGLNVVDVTKRVAELLHSEPDGFSARADWLKSDPLPYKTKALVIAYDYKGRHYLFVTTQKVSYQLLVEYAQKTDEPHPPSDL